MDARCLLDGRLRQSLYVALGAVVLVLLIACANLTNLLLARGVSRQKEIALRVALGAGRGRLIAQLLTESAVLGLLGGLAGVALAAALISIAIPLLPVAIPFTASIELNLRVLAFATVAALAVSIVVGILPAIRLSAGAPAAALNSVSRGASVRHDRVRGLGQRLQTAAAEAIDCRPGRLDRKTGHQADRAGHVEALFALLLGVAQYNVLDRARVNSRSRDERANDLDGKVVGADVAKNTLFGVRPANGRATAVNYDGVLHVSGRIVNLEDARARGLKCAMKCCFSERAAPPLIIHRIVHSTVRIS